MVELLVIILAIFTIIKASKRLVTPLWAILELIAWTIGGALLWFARRLLGADIVLTVLVGIAFIVVWALGRHVRALREDISRLNEELARR